MIGQPDKCRPVSDERPVDRKAEGDNHSHRYLVEFNDVVAMEVQLRFVLDQKDRVVLVEMEGAQWK
jgi:hypothetical protein